MCFLSIFVLYRIEKLFVEMKITSADNRCNTDQKQKNNKKKQGKLYFISMYDHNGVITENSISG
jgi:hypothetical protein